MSAKLLRLFPDGLKATDCERFKPRQPPAIPFLSKTLSSSDEVGDDTSIKTIAVELNSKTTTKVVSTLHLQVCGVVLTSLPGGTRLHLGPAGGKI